MLKPGTPAADITRKGGGNARRVGSLPSRNGPIHPFSSKRSDT